MPGGAAEPHVRVLVTADCNLSCPYCRPGGEGCIIEGTTPLHTKEIVSIVRACSDLWARHAKISGGEPLLRQDLPSLLSALSSLGVLETIQVVTNGVLLGDRYSEMQDSGITGITVSLDTTDPDRYAAITGHALVERVLAGIDVVRSRGRHPITINSVVMRRNLGDVPELVRYSDDVGATLKLIDFMKLEYSPQISWEAEYVDFSLLASLLELDLGLEFAGVEAPAGGLGTPQLRYRTRRGGKVLLRAAQVGTNYHPSCRECRCYPCHDALISMRITHNGFIKRCLVRDDNLIDLKGALSEGDGARLRDLISGALRYYREAIYYPLKWSPAVELHRAAGRSWDEGWA